MIGVNVEELPDGLIIHGDKELKGKLYASIPIDSFNDHRIAMSFAIASLISREKTTILNTFCVDTSFPDFWNILEKL